MENEERERRDNGKSQVEELIETLVSWSRALLYVTVGMAAAGVLIGILIACCIFAM